MVDILKIKDENGDWVTVQAFQGQTGLTPHIQIGQVEAGATPSDAAASMSGTKEFPFLNLTLPRGYTGEPGVAIASSEPQTDQLVWIDTGSPTSTKTIPEIDDTAVNFADTWSSAKIQEFVYALRDIIYPIGSIYLSINNINPSTFLGGGWESVGEGRVLQGVNLNQTAGTTVDAGLPNITGEINADTNNKYQSAFEASSDQAVVRSGAFSESVLASRAGFPDSSSNYLSISKLDFNASLSNSIYGNSTTVQPPAYLIYIWKRTA